MCTYCVRSPFSYPPHQKPDHILVSTHQCSATRPGRARARGKAQTFFFLLFFPVSVGLSVGTPDNSKPVACSANRQDPNPIFAISVNPIRTLTWNLRLPPWTKQNGSTRNTERESSSTVSVDFRPATKESMLKIINDVVTQFTATVARSLRL